MHNEKGQQVDESNNTVLYQKILFRDKWTILCLKMVHPDNSESALRILLRFCGIKGDNRCMKILFFEKKFHFGQFDLFSLEAIFHCLIGHGWNWARSLATIGSLNSQDMITFMNTAGSLNSQDMIRILKQSRHDFSGKHLCDGYCMDIMWCLCVEVKIHGFIKLV